jgi:hypothetical protein
MTPVDLVERQLDAYNARDLERFLACYADDVRVYRPPAAEPAFAGIAALAAFYRDERFNRPALHAALVHRVALGARVVDHERISGVRDAPFDAVVVYAIAAGRIATVWMFAD